MLMVGKPAACGGLPCIRRYSVLRTSSPQPWAYEIATSSTRVLIVSPAGWKTPPAVDESDVLTATIRGVPLAANQADVVPGPRAKEDLTHPLE